MQAGIRVFLEGIIDYAGLFPPADLPLAQAVADYVRYWQGPDSWMLSRFIVPAARLRELAEFRDAVAPIAPLRLSVLGRGGSDVQDFLNNVRSDITDFERLAQTLPDGVKVENYEVKLPAGLCGMPAPDYFATELFAVIGMVRNMLDASLLRDIVPFFEFPPMEPDAVRLLARRTRSDEMRVREFLHDWDSPEDHEQARFPRPGWKLRCGGVQASAFPSVDQVAVVLSACGQCGIPWKATAGLHHPLHHFDKGLNTPMHGFVNVFGAGVIAHACQIVEAEVVEILRDEDPRHFTFDEAGLHWQNRSVGIEAIRSARRNFVTSFGSCSFEEPCADLRGLGWM